MLALIIGIIATRYILALVIISTVITIFLILADTPDAPGSPSIEDIDSDSVTLSWTKPKSDGGDKLQGYVVEYKEKGIDKCFYMSYIINIKYAN